MKQYNRLAVSTILMYFLGGLLCSSIHTELSQIKSTNKAILQRINIINMRIKIIEIEHEQLVNVPKDVTPSYEYLKSITVYINGKIPEKERRYGTKVVAENWTGTGVIVKIDKKYTYILTNAHVAGNNRAGVSLFVENDLQVLKSDITIFHNDFDTVDLALIRVKGVLDNKQSIKGIGTAYPSEKVYLVGNYLSKKYLYAEGWFSGYDGIHSVVQVPVCYGNSGSAVVNKQGELVGLVFAMYKVGWIGVDTSKSVCVSSPLIEQFLHSVGITFNN